MLNREQKKKKPPSSESKNEMIIPLSVYVKTFPLWEKHKLMDMHIIYGYQYVRHIISFVLVIIATM